MSDPSGESGGRQSWKGSGGGGGEWRRPEGVHSWRRPEHGGPDDDRPSGSARIRRKVFKSLAAVMTTTACIVAAVWLIVILQRGCTETKLQPIVATIPDDRAPQLPPDLPNPADLDALNSLIKKYTQLVKPGTSPPSRKTPLVIYLSAIWSTDDKGDVRVITSKNPKFDSLDGSEQPASTTPGDFPTLTQFLSSKIVFPPRQNTLVLLDLCQGYPNWEIGVLENDIELAIRAAITKITKTSNTESAGNSLAVILSCSRGERSWASPHLGIGQTAFGFWSGEGLSGKADKKPSDNLIRVSELFGYIRSETNFWVRQNRDRNGQHPVLITNGEKDFFVVRAGPTRKPDETTVKNVRKPDETTVKNVPLTVELNDLEKLWGKRNTLGRDGEQSILPAYHHDPLRWKELTFRLRRAEHWIFWNRPTKAKLELGRARKLIEHLGQKSFPDARGDKFVQQNIIARLADRLSEDGAQFSLPKNTASILRPGDHLGSVLKNLPGHLKATDERQTLDELAIGIRDRAERITSGAFGTYHRVHRRLASADRARRDAEDLLIIGDKAAESSLKLAEKHLDKAKRIRSTLFAALLLRNRLRSELPDLARWAAFRNTTELDGYKEVLEELARTIQFRQQRLTLLSGARDIPAEGQSGKVDLAGAKVHYRLMALFEQAHRLDKLLDDSLDPDTTEDLTVEQLEPLQQLVFEARTRLTTLHKALEDRGTDYLKDTSVNPELWRKIQDILRHTGLKAVTRCKLLEHSIQLSFKLNRQSEDTTVSLKAKPRPPSKVPGMLHGLWAIKVLWLGRKLDIDLEDDDKGSDLRTLSHTWRGVDEMSVAVWPTTFRKLGAEIRKVSSKKRRYMVRLVDAAAKQTKVELRRRDLMLADRIARSLPASDVIDVRGKKKDPTRALRRFQLSELLYAHAERYLDDFWKGWFETAAKQCIDAAKEPPGVHVFDKRAKTLDARLEQRIQLAKRIADGDFIETHSDTLRFGICDKADLTVAFTPFAGAPPGSAAVWLELYSNEKGLLSLQDPPVHKQTISPSTAKRTTTKFTLLRDASLKLTAGGQQSACPGLVLKALPHLFYRGHTANKQSLAISIDPCPPPVFVVKHVPLTKTTGQVSVEGTSKRQAVMFIIDCSGSMKSGLANPADETKRWGTATKRLGEVIRGLSKSDEPVKPVTGLIAFGHRVTGIRNPETEIIRIEINEKYPDLEKEHPEIAKDPWKDIQVVRPFSPLSNEHLTKTLDQIKDLKPFGATPSLAAIQRALSEFKRRQSGGVIVLITDGIYSLKSEDPDDLKQALGTLQKGLHENPGVSLQVVLFGQSVKQLGVDPKNKSKVAGLRKVLGSGTGHRLREAPTGDQLANELAAAIAARPYFILDGDPGNKSPRTNRQLGDNSPALKPGNYSVGYESIRPIQFEIQGGEKHRFELQRGAILRYRPPKERDRLKSADGLFGEAKDGMKLICSEHRLVSQELTGMLSRNSAVFTLCLVGQGEQDIVSRPREILFDIVPLSEAKKSLGKQRSRTTYWEVVSETTAPTWRVKVNDWPGSEAATIQAFWKSTPTRHDESPKRAWKEVEEDSAQVEVPLPGFPRTNVRLGGKRRDAGKKIEITITPTDKTRPRVAGFHEHFGRLLPKLVWENGTNVADLEYSSKFTCEPGKEQLVYTFTWPSKLEFKPDELSVQIVSWTERVKNSQQLTKPLVTRPFPPE